MAGLAAAPHHNQSASSSTASGSASTPNVFISFCDYNRSDRDVRTFANKLRSLLISRKLQVFLDSPDLRDLLFDDIKVPSNIKDTISAASVHIVIISPNYAQSTYCLNVLVLLKKSRATIVPVFYYVQPYEVRWTGKDNNGVYAQALSNYEKDCRYQLTVEEWRAALSHVADLSGCLVEDHLGEEALLLDTIVEGVFKGLNFRSSSYDVFINHRGPDVKKPFATSLYDRLTSRGLRVFLDEPELVEGVKISSQIELAIGLSSVHIAIFSPTYAKSNWCLDELFLMTKSGATIIPVYYNVTPSDLQLTRENRDGDGEYAKALRRRQKKERSDLNTLQKWRKALSEVAELPGFKLHGNPEKDLEIWDDIETRVKSVVNSLGKRPEVLSSELQRVVEIVVNDPNPCNVVQSVSKESVSKENYYFGLAEKLEEFEKAVLSHKIEEHGEPKVVGIVGDNGVGKTTLAIEYVKQKRSYYTTSSFLFGVRESSLIYLQKKLIKDLERPRNEMESVNGGRNEIEILQRHRSYCSVLVIVDDVDHEDQLKAILSINVLPRRSLILVTSRYKNVLNNSGIVDSSIYHVGGLNRLHSKELLCSYAFYQRRPPSEFAHLVDEVLKVCDGWPLSLKVWGALLSEEDDKGYWQRKLKQLPGILPSETHGRLRISYDSLNPGDKLIFLDIACFCLVEDRDTAIRIWGSEGIRNLENKCLLDVDSENAIRMQNQIRDLGIYIAQGGSMPRRLWRPTHHIDHLFYQSSPVKPQVRGIATVPCLKFPDGVVDTKMSSEISLSRWSDEMSGYCLRDLQIVATEGSYLKRILERVPSPHLTWLRWYNCPDSSLPPWIPMDKLRVLQVQGSKLERLWQSESQSESQAPLQLRELNIQAPLLEFPQSLGKLQNLEKIVVENLVDGEVPLVPLSEEFCNLFSLKFLKLRGCYKFRMLPHSFGNLRNLEHIDLYGCKNLYDLPVSFGNLTNLQHIDLSGCTSLKMLPDSFGNLTNMQHIVLSGWSRLETLPDFFWNLTNLQHIDLSGCAILGVLPNSFGKLTNLQYIDLSGCERLGMLPNSFSNLKKLQHIDLSGCESLKMLPKSLGNLTNVKHIDLFHCARLEMLPDSLGYLTNLQEIHLSDCASLGRLPDSLGDLKNLQHIDLFGCKKLIKLPNSLGNLINLKHIDLSGCSRLKMLPKSLKNLTNLQHIDLSHCRSLQVLPYSVGNLTNLQHINLSGWARLEKLPDFLGNLTDLQHIDLSDCESLKKLPDSWGNLKNLQHLNLSFCYSLEIVPDYLENLTNLQHLKLSRCQSLARLLASMGNLTNLQDIDLSYCKTLEMLPDSLGNLTNLQHIDLSDCESLKTLPESWGNLKNLQHLNLSFCKSLEMLPDSSGNLTNLQQIDLSHCKSLKMLPDSLGNLTNLQRIYLSHCESLKALPDSLGNLKNLQHIDLSDCKSLEMLPHSLGNLTNLQHIDLSDCKSLEMLPDSLGNLTNLQHIGLSGCAKLKKLPDSLGNLTNLHHVALSGSNSLEMIPNSLKKFTNAADKW